MTPSINGPMDNPFFTFMGKLGDLVCLNLLWLAGCLPVITAGASTAALHYVARKMAAGEPYRVFGSFRSAFRENFGSGTRLWLCLLAALGLFLGDLWAGFVMPGALGSLFRGIGIAFIVLWLLAAGYAFPLLARYREKTGRLLLLALTLAARRPGVTLCYMALVLAMPALLLILPQLFALALLPWALTGEALYAWLMAILLLPVQREMERTGGTEYGDPKAETGL